MKNTKRKGFNFFRSYYDVFNELPEKDKLPFIEALLDRQFLGIKPTNLKGMSKFAWISQVNSIDSQVKGYEDKTGVKLTPTVGGLITPTLQVEEKEKEKVQVKEKGEAPPIFSNPDKLELFNLWVQYRKEIKKPIKSKISLKSLVVKFEEIEFNHLKFTIINSINNGWQGLFFEKYIEEKGNKSLSLEDKYSHLI